MVTWGHKGVCGNIKTCGPNAEVNRQKRLAIKWWYNSLQQERTLLCTARCSHPLKEGKLSWLVKTTTTMQVYVKRTANRRRESRHCTNFSVFTSKWEPKKIKGVNEKYCIKPKNTSSLPTQHFNFKTKKKKQSMKQCIHVCLCLYIYNNM